MPDETDPQPQPRRVPRDRFAWSRPIMAKNPMAKTLAQQPLWLQRELDAILEHRAKIHRALSDEAYAERFYVDPVAALRELGIPVSRRLSKTMRDNLAKMSRPQDLVVRMPNGEVVHAPFERRVVPGGGNT